MKRNNNPGTLIVRDGKLVTAGEEPATDADTANTTQPLKRPVQAGGSMDDPHEKLDSPVAKAICQTLTTYRDYFSQGYREALAKDLTEKVQSLGELSSTESISAVVRRSIDWSGHAVPQQEIPTITTAVTTAIQTALR